jgi:hypothetical protein
MILLPGGEISYRANARCHPIVRYRGRRAEFDLYDQGMKMLHIICPKCAGYGLIAETNKPFIIDERGKLTIFEPFRCDYCLARFRVTDGVMSDAP